MRFKELWRGVREWMGGAWDNIRPGHEARKGAMWGAILVALGIAIVAGIYFQSGFGLGADLAFTLAFSMLALPLAALLVVLLLKILSSLPRMFTGILIGVCVLCGLAFFPQLGIL